MQFVSPGIMKNYEQMEAEKTKLLIATQRMKVVEKGSDVDRVARELAFETRILNIMIM